MFNWQRSLPLAVLALSAATTLRADLISEALLCFPAQTEYVEYDNLEALRTLPDYNILRQRFSGKPLEDAKTALGQLGVLEIQVHEVVTGSNATGFYGVVAGPFSGEAATSNAKRNGLGIKVGENQVLCPGGGTCIVFLEASLAAFGSLDQLKEMLETRQGIKARLSSKRDAATLLTNTDRYDPVRGIVLGKQLHSDVADMLNDWTGWKRDWSTLSGNVTAIGYGVRFDSKTHVAATLECSSKASAGVLLQMLNALGSLGGGSAPFQNLQVSSSGTNIDFKVDTALPTATPAPTANRR
jgi:hypothetical protein